MSWASKASCANGREDIYGASSARKQWFKQVLELALTASIIDQYRDFERLTDSALEMVAKWSGVDLDKKDKAALRAKRLELPSHADVQPAFNRLRTSKLRLAVLTNSTHKTVLALRHERTVLSIALDRQSPYAIPKRLPRVDVELIMNASVHARQPSLRHPAPNFTRPIRKKMA